MDAYSTERRAAQTTLYEVLKAMVVIIAPILSHTAEEIWQHLEMDKKSVFLNDFPSPKDEFINSSLAGEMERILRMREKVLSSLEEARRGGLIGNSLEAKVELKVPDEDIKVLSKYTPHLPSIFIVSQVSVDSADEGEMDVQVVRADGEKCARCWNYRVDVGCDSRYPTLCGRCIDVVKKLNERRDGNGGERIGKIQAEVTDLKGKFD
jgi:isoleucyl-tRNA synthetase